MFEIFFTVKIVLVQVERQSDEFAIFIETGQQPNTRFAGSSSPHAQTNAARNKEPLECAAALVLTPHNASPVSPPQHPVVRAHCATPSHLNLDVRLTCPRWRPPQSSKNVFVFQDCTEHGVETPLPTRLFPPPGHRSESDWPVRFSVLS